jgi:hypothetical protein
MMLWSIRTGAFILREVTSAASADAVASVALGVLTLGQCQLAHVPTYLLEPLARQYGGP